MIKDHRLSMRIPAALRDALDALAKADRRSLASYVEGILADHVHQHEIKIAKAELDIQEARARISLPQRPARPHPKP